MIRITVAITLALLFGCQKENPAFCAAHPGEQGCANGDGGSDAPLQCDPQVASSCPAKQLCSPDHVCVAACFGSGPFEICLTALPAMDTVMLNGSLNTGTDGRCATPVDWPAKDPDPDTCVIAGTTVTVDNDLSVVGSKPLVVLARDTLTVAKKIDAASHVKGTLGPGATDVPAGTCPAGTAPQDEVNGNNLGGGGAGGSLRDLGGVGGTADSGGSITPGGAPGAKVAADPTDLRAGCQGQTGGAGGAQGGFLGTGGGAVFLLAGQTLAIHELVNVSGAAGEGGHAGGGGCGGGGGGGSGGMLVLFAPAIDDMGAKLVANGGGGGSGCNSGASGNDGKDPDPMMVTMQAPGGMAPGGGGGPGGTGAAGATLAGDPGIAGGGNHSGGGGGGAAGYIQSNKTLTKAVASPQVTVK